ncbi:MAG TPA: hypothetical protein V6D46_02005 [Coleofasciculaceae cyanobacterium]
MPFGKDGGGRIDLGPPESMLFLTERDRPPPELRRIRHCHPSGLAARSIPRGG